MANQIVAHKEGHATAELQRLGGLLTYTVYQDSLTSSLSSAVQQVFRTRAELLSSFELQVTSEVPVSDVRQILQPFCPASEPSAYFDL